MEIDKIILTQLCSHKKELSDLRRRKEDNDREIERLEDNGTVVSDSVTCGKKGKKPLGTKRITGFPMPEYEKRLRYKRAYSNMLEHQITKIDKEIAEAEQYIESIPDSRIRRICRYRCLDDSLSWISIAHKMGKQHTADGCRMAFERFLKNN